MQMNANTQKPSRYKRYNIPGSPHGLTFTCFKNRKYFDAHHFCKYFCNSVNLARIRHEFDVWAYVIMPEHVHLIVYPRSFDYSISDILKGIKQSTSRKAINYLKINNPEKLRLHATGLKHHKYRFWQDGGGYDRVIRGAKELRRLIGYIHENPVRRGLVSDPFDWDYCSAREWHSGEAGPIKLNLEYFPK